MSALTLPGMTGTQVQACTCKSRSGFRTLPGSSLAVCADCDWPAPRALQVLGHLYATALTAEAVANAVDAKVLVLDPREGHLATCTEFCAIVHCPCGRDAMHGARTCSVCPKPKKGKGKKAKAKAKAEPAKVERPAPRVTPEHWAWCVCQGCRIYRCEEEGNTATPCTGPIGKHAKPYDPALDPEPLTLEEVQAAEAGRIQEALEAMEAACPSESREEDFGIPGEFVAMGPDTFEDMLVTGTAGNIQPGYLTSDEHRWLTLQGVADLPPVTTINGVDVDVRSEAPHETECAECTTPIRIEVVPEGLKPVDVIGKTRVGVCMDCVHLRTNGRPVEVLNPQKEKPVIDLTQYSEGEVAELAVDAREHMVAKAAAALPGKRKKAVKAKRKAEAADKAAAQLERERLRTLVLPAFTVAGVEVPALDFTDVTHVGEVVSKALRSPYNKALHALEKDLLAKDVTYADLEHVHIDLQALAVVAKKAKKAKAGKAKAGKAKAKISKAPVLIAEPVDKKGKAKVVAYAKVHDLSIADAQAELASMGLI